MQRHKSILHFEDINQSHEYMGFTGRTDVPGFHIHTLEETYPSTRRVMPPYTFRFYCVMLLNGYSDDAVVELNARRADSPSNTLSFQSPGCVSAWVRGRAQQGYLLYFQPEFLSHHPAPLMEEFPFFRLSELGMLSVTKEQKAVLQEHFAHLERTFKNNDHPYRVPMLQALLLAFLFDCKGLYENYHACQRSPILRPSLTTRFLQAVEQHYLVLRTVRAYADLLHVTPNHLSLLVASETGQKAHDLIADRVLLEAKQLLYYTDLSIGEVAEYLSFEEPTHFIRLFKRKSGLTPLAYRATATRR